MTENQDKNQPTVTVTSDDGRLYTMNPEDRQILLALYDIDKNGELSRDECLAILEDYHKYKVSNRSPYSSKLALVEKILDKYDVRNDGFLTGNSGEHLHNELNNNDGIHYNRIAGYASAFARAARYLAFTSDVGEALRPVVAARVVTGTYAISFGYCLSDIALSAYSLHENNYMTKKNEPMTLEQCVVEKTVFHAVASIGAPFVLIHGTVDITHRIFKRIGRFNRWGPSICGLLMIPFLPIVDHPIEEFLEHGFEKYGPWAKPSGPTKDHKD